MFEYLESCYQYSLGRCVLLQNGDVCQAANTLPSPRNMSEKLADMGSVNIQAWIDFSGKGWDRKQTKNIQKQADSERVSEGKNALQ